MGRACCCAVTVKPVFYYTKFFARGDLLISSCFLLFAKLAHHKRKAVVGLIILFGADIKMIIRGSDHPDKCAWLRHSGWTAGLCLTNAPLVINGISHGFHAAYYRPGGCLKIAEVLSQRMLQKAQNCRCDEKDQHLYPRRHARNRESQCQNSGCQR